MKTSLIIPTLNASENWQALVDGIRQQDLAPDKVLVIDSSSTDGTASLARAAGFSVIEIDRRTFNHGATRQAAAARLPDADVLIYMTQDAVPCIAKSFRNLISAFSDPGIGAAYGRQIPRPHASGIETHARFFNYPPKSKVRSWASRSILGFKSIFFSNTFGAFRRSALMSIGGFSRYADFGEDTLAVAQLHRAGWKTAYVADALVQHSHANSLISEFRRYFQIGVFHGREHWLVDEFGSAGGEGRRFVLSELSYLLKHDPVEIPSALIRTLLKFAAYQAGRHERFTALWSGKTLPAKFAKLSVRRS